MNAINKRVLKVGINSTKPTENIIIKSIVNLEELQKLNPSIKHHMVIGIFIGIWLFIFAFFIRPFDDGTITFKMWLLISLGFSLIAFLCYLLITVIQKSIYQKASKWNISFEIASLLLFQLLFLVCTYIYYKCPVLNGGYGFFEFSRKIILKLALISTPIIVLARIYSVKLIPKQLEDENIVIRGENKLDILRIRRDDLVCVSNIPPESGGQYQRYIQMSAVNTLKTP